MLQNVNQSKLQVSHTIGGTGTIKQFLLLVLVILSTGCANTTDNNMEPSKNKIRQDALSKIDILTCLDNGGVIKSVCMLGIPFCIQNHMDAGKACSDSAECSGDCRREDEFVEAGSKAAGVCSADNDPCGCFQIITSGVAQDGICD